MYEYYQFEDNCNNALTIIDMLDFFFKYFEHHNDDDFSVVIIQYQYTSWQLLMIYMEEFLQKFIYQLHSLKRNNNIISILEYIDSSTIAGSLHKKNIYKLVFEIVFILKTSKSDVPLENKHMIIYNTIYYIKNCSNDIKYFDFSNIQLLDKCDKLSFLLNHKLNYQSRRAYLKLESGILSEEKNNNIIHYIFDPTIVFEVCSYL
jgi:hypothetical protein